MTHIVVAASVSCFILGGLTGLLAIGLTRRTCQSCEWRRHFSELDPAPDPVVHRKFLTRVYDAMEELPTARLGRVPDYDCSARRAAILHNEVAALLGIDGPHRL